MFAKKALAASVSAGPKTYVEDVFSTYLYSGNGAEKSIKNDIRLGASYSGTTLKLNFDSNNTDSANSFTATVTGTAGYTTADSKFGAGSCAGFDAASWLEYNPEAGNFGSGDWTVEFWVKTSSGNGPGIVTQAFGGGAANTSWGFFVGYGTSGNVALYLSDGSSYFASITSGTTAVNNNTWNHVAACRSGSTVYLFLNGVSQGTASVGTTALGNGGAPVRIGAQGSSYAMPSGTYIDDVRIIKGTALYTSGFTPPSAATNTTSYPPTTTAGEGGMVWFKNRNGTLDHAVFDTARGATKSLRPNDTVAEATETGGLTSFNSNGFSLGTWSRVNYTTSDTYVSWTFRKAKKFFDVVTYTGTGSPRTVSHNLGSAPGCIIVKRYDSTGSWAVWHRSGTQTNGKFAAFLNDPGAYEDQAANLWGSETVAPDMNASTFGVGTAGSTNSNGSTYVAYLFAHDAGGFGDAGSDNVITCGSYTGNGSTSGPTVTLGYEPQWLMIKASSTTGSWQMIDNMRGMVVGGNEARLIANSSSAELSNDYLSPTATGFQLVSTSSEVNGNGQTYIYIAIRRGPMKTPTSGTDVFYQQAIAQADTIDSTGVPFSPDLVNTFSRDGSNRTSTFQRFQFADRLRSLGAPSNTLSGSGCPSLTSSSSDAEATSSTYIQLKADGRNITRANGWSTYGNWINYFWKRAPGFFDVVCYTGTGSNITVNHNLGVTPEFIIAKDRSAGYNWICYHKDIGSTGGYPNYLKLNDTTATSAGDSTIWRGVSSTTFSYGTNASLNSSGDSIVAYLFASVSGVSKVGSFNNAGSDFDVNCGFTNGARFVLVKRYSSTGGGWFVFDSARGIVAGNDPLLGLNSTAAEDTSGDYIDTYSQGFRFNGSAFATGDYIFLAIA